MITVTVKVMKHLKESHKKPKYVINFLIKQKQKQSLKLMSLNDKIKCNI